MIRPDFVSLCQRYPELEVYAIHKKKRRQTTGDSSAASISFDWTNDAFQRTLTTVLLKDEYNIDVYLPDNRLCPPVPNRVNYISWLADLLSTTPGPREDPVTVLDVGVGASCIYPLLGHAKFGWHFTGIDIDPQSLQWADANVRLNGLSEAIHLHLVEACDSTQQRLHAAIIDHRPPHTVSTNSRGPVSEVLREQCVEGGVGGCRGPVRRALMAAASTTTTTTATTTAAAAAAATVLAYEHAFESESDPVPSPCPYQSPLYSACLTNPPFYHPTDLIRPSHRTVCTSTINESTTTGGEVAFVAAILADSLVLRTAVGWYTAMLGKKQSLQTLLRVLKAEGVTNVEVKVFQGYMVGDNHGRGNGDGNGIDDGEDVAEDTVADNTNTSSSNSSGGRTRRWGLAWSFLPPSSPSASSSSLQRNKSTRPSSSLPSLPPSVPAITTTEGALQATQLPAALPQTLPPPSSPPPAVRSPLVIVQDTSQITLQTVSRDAALLDSVPTVHCMLSERIRLAAKRFQESTTGGSNPPQVVVRPATALVVRELTATPLEMPKGQSEEWSWHWEVSVSVTPPVALALPVPVTVPQLTTQQPTDVLTLLVRCIRDTSTDIVGSYSGSCSGSGSGRGSVSVSGDCTLEITTTLAPHSSLSTSTSASTHHPHGVSAHSHLHTVLTTFHELLHAEILRTNRRWRRRLQAATASGTAASTATVGSSTTSTA